MTRDSSHSDVYTLDYTACPNPRPFRKPTLVLSEPELRNYIDNLRCELGGAVTRLNDSLDSSGWIMADVGTMIQYNFTSARETF